MDEYEPSNPINTFGEELRAHRQKAGMRITDLASKLLMSDAMVGAIERGTRAARFTTAKECDEIFAMPGTFERLWRPAAASAVPSHVTPYYDLEQQATRIHKWELRCIPGLLQTADYARAIMRVGWPRENDELIEDDVKTRIERQQILTRDKPPLAWFVIDEAVLHKPYGNMPSQLQQLVKLAVLPNVIIQIMPYKVANNPGPEGPLTILEFADSPPIAYAQGRGSGRLIESADEVADAMTCYDLIRAAALRQDASLALIKQAGGSK